MGYTFQMLLDPAIDLRNLKCHASEDTKVRAIYTYLWLEKTQVQVAQFFLIDQSTLSRWLFKAFSPVDSSDEHHNRKLSDEDIEYIKEVLNNNAVLYLTEMVDMLRDNRGVDVSPSTVHRALVHAGFTYKSVRHSYIEQNAN
ncbi:hypothetical protein GEMRC1_008861 [Eukaryota sp. GEM-RC1]